MSELKDVIRPGETRGLDFVILDELRRLTTTSGAHLSLMGRLQNLHLTSLLTSERLIGG